MFMQIVSTRRGGRSKSVAEPDEWLLNQIIAASRTEQKGNKIPGPHLKVVKGIRRKWKLRPHEKQLLP
jgi:hypothetical protein